MPDYAGGPTTTRYLLKAKSRGELLESIEYVLHMITTLLVTSPDSMLLDEGEDASAFYFMQCQAHMLIMSYTVKLLQRLTKEYFQRRRLGHNSSGGMLPGASHGKRGPPPTLSDWVGDQCVARTRFTVEQVREILTGFQLVDGGGRPKRFKIYQSRKRYQKRKRDGTPIGVPCDKYFYVNGETALMVLLINLAYPTRYCDMQLSLNGIPSPEISLIIAFMFEYLSSWTDK